jgi:SP family myo-inositol transporter-like MFS transporter 13
MSSHPTRPRAAHVPFPFAARGSPEQAVVSATVGLAILGAAVAGWLGDALGRRPVILLSSAVFLAGSVIMGFAPGFAVLILGRSVVGFAVGLSSMMVPLYLAEASPPHFRGTIVTLNTLTCTGGQLVAGLVGGAFSGVPDGWRWVAPATPTRGARLRC